MSGRIIRVLAMLVLACITCAGSMYARKGKAARRPQTVRQGPRSKNPARGQ